MTESDIRQNLKMQIAEAKEELKNPVEGIRWGKEQNEISLKSINSLAERFKGESIEKCQELYNRALKYIKEHEEVLTTEQLPDFDKTLKYLSALAKVLDKKDYFAPCFLGTKQCGKLK